MTAFAPPAAAPRPAPIDAPAPTVAAGAPLIEARGLTVEEDGRRLLDRVDLSLRPGEAATIVGPNGGGKTTLLRALIGSARLSAGAVTRRPDLVIGYMPQKLAIDRTMPISLDRFLRLGAPGESRAARRAVMARVGIERLSNRQMCDLSGGELQRALLARALLRRPNLLMLDEPTQGLDQPGEAAFYRLLAKLKRDLGLAVLLVSHDLRVVMGSAERVICLNAHICCEGAPEHVSAHPEYERLFGVEDEDAFAIYRHHHDHEHELDGACRMTQAPEKTAGRSC